MGWSILYSPGSSATQLGAADLTTVQNAVDAAATGATIRLPLNGSSTWGGTLTVTKAITLDGNGCDISKGFVSESPLMAVTTSAAGRTRITGFDFKYSSAKSGYNKPYYLTIDGSFSNPKFRIDHCTFGTIPDSDNTHVVIGKGHGLMDHCTFDSSGASETVHIEAYGNGDASGWTYSVTPGSDEAVYIEDCTFTWSGGAYTGANAAIQNYYGSRSVIRHNTIHSAVIDFHGTPGMIGARWYEVYENDWYYDNNMSVCVALRAGSGVVYNNRLHAVGGGATGSPDVSFREEDSGAWPTAYQVGSGYNGGSDGHATCASGARNQSPVYMWGNDFAYSLDTSTPYNATAIGSSSLNRDFFYSSGSTPPATHYIGQSSSYVCGDTITYSAYTYPHPLQSA